MRTPKLLPARPALLLLAGGLLLPALPAADEGRIPGLVASLKGHKEAVYGIAFTPDGKQLVTAGGDPSIKIWDAAGKELKTYSGPNVHRPLVLSVAVSP